MFASRNSRSTLVEALGMTARRTRPNPLGSRSSTATITISLPNAPRPPSPACSPPTKVSSTSTVPLSLSWPARPIAVRKRCSIVQSVWYDPRPSSLCICSADTPFFVLAMYQAAANHTVSGVRVSWKMVPAVRETRRRQPAPRLADRRDHLPGHPHAADRVVRGGLVHGQHEERRVRAADAEAARPRVVPDGLDDAAPLPHGDGSRWLVANEVFWGRQKRWGDPAPKPRVNMPKESDLPPLRCPILPLFRGCSPPSGTERVRPPKDTSHLGGWVGSDRADSVLEVLQELRCD